MTAIYLHNPKYTDNLARVVRAAACFGVGEVFYSGNRVLRSEVEEGRKGKKSAKKRLPRELRMYKEVAVKHVERLTDCLLPETIPIALEFGIPGAETLFDFNHPLDKASESLYVFGPEDGSLDRDILRYCHRFVTIPTSYCANLSAAVYMVLYDRVCKEHK